MSDIQSIENKLSELIPSSVSQQGLNRMDETIDGLSQKAEADGYGRDVAASSVHVVESRQRWYDMASWRIAAVFAILVVSSVGLATKVGLLEISLKPDSTLSASATPIEQPQSPQLIQAVVSSTEAPENNHKQFEGLGASNASKLSKHGMVVERLDHVSHAQLPEIQPSSGLVIKKIEPAGLADKAGLLPLDIICQVDDQWAINGEQLEALLSMPHNEGEVSVTYYRAGKKENVMMGVENTATSRARVKDINSSASISDSEGTGTLSYREGKLWLRVESTKGV